MGKYRWPNVRSSRWRQGILPLAVSLTLVTQSFNSGVSNLAFPVKRREFEDQSILMLNKDFVKSEGWSEAEIEGRGKTLFELARQVWQRP